jgi:hypothetical protein
MPKIYDTTFREMFGKGLPALLPWLLPDVISCEVLKEDKDLATTTRWPDLVLRVDPSPSGRARKRKQASSVLQIFECQCQADPDLPRSMLTRAILAHDLHDLPVQTTVLALAPVAVPPARYIYGRGSDGEELHHSVMVRRVFEESADAALQRDIAELLPLVPVMAPDDGDRSALLRRVVARIVDRVAVDEKRKMLVEQAANFATLRLSRPQVRDIVADVLRRRRIMIDPLRDFPLVRDGYRKGIREGKREGIREGIREGETRGQAKSLLTLLDARGIKVNSAMRAKILACTDAATLDRWLKNALHASSVAEIIGAQ